MKPILVFLIVSGHLDAFYSLKVYAVVVINILDVNYEHYYNDRSI